MKFLAAATFPVLATGYAIGGYGPFGLSSPRVAISSYACAPARGRGTRGQVDCDFDNLRAEMSTSPNPDQIRQQQECLNRAFALAAEVTEALSQQGRSDQNSALQQKEFFSKAFGLASEIASGYSSPLHEILQNDQELFQIAMDVPGVKASDMYICVKPEGKNNVMIVSGERSDLLGPENTPRKFSKNFLLDPNVNTDSILAELSNGVLVVSATKRVDKNASSKRIHVKQISDDDTK